MVVGTAKRKAPRWNDFTVFEIKEKWLDEGQSKVVIIVRGVRQSYKAVSVTSLEGEKERTRICSSFNRDPWNS